MYRLLEPVRTTDPRPDPAAHPAQALYIRTYLLVRVLIGALGVLLPVMVVVIDGFGFDGSPFPRGSVSAYYYSGMREEFVVIIGATGVFLVAYKIAERNLDNLASVVAGTAAVLVAVFPTGVPSSTVPLTPLQDAIGQTTTKWIHFVSAGAFLVALAVVTYFFGLREGRRARRPGTRPPEFWKWFHWSCTIVMGLALVWIAVTHFADWPSQSLLVGEWVAAWAFGVSWFAKGAEWDMIRNRPAKPLD